MKKLFTFLFLFVGFCAIVNAQKKPYNNLIITEARLNSPELNYVEVTNMGTETIDLSEFTLNGVNPWYYPFRYFPNQTWRFPKKMLAPNKSYVISTAKKQEMKAWLTDPLHNRERTYNPELSKMSDFVFNMLEDRFSLDSVTPSYYMMLMDIFYLRHFYEVDGVLDSMIVDQMGGVFDEADGTSYPLPYDVAGAKDATYNSILIRKASVTTGITEFSSHEANAEAAKMQFANNRGLDLADSEWIPVPIQGNRDDGAYWRIPYWTIGNQGDYKLDANTLVSKTPGKIKVDLTTATITVPWGVRYDDSIMVQLVKKPGLAWQYDYATTKEDSAYTSARTGDKLTIYACGKEATVKTFSIIVSDPTPSDNIVISKANFNYVTMKSTRRSSVFMVSDGVSGMDTISKIPYATRIDTLFKYMEKAPKASWKIIPKDGVNRPDLKLGDKLQVTSENGLVKEYFIKVNKFLANNNARLSSITWPDMPPFFKGDVAKFYGWKGDTIPAFGPGINAYIVNIPMDYQGIPALMFTKESLNSKVVVNRARSLEGTVADATATFTVTAEDGITKNVYTVRFNKEKDPSNIQPFVAEPYFSQCVSADRYLFPWVEIVNPGTEVLDLSNYIIMDYYYGNAAEMNGEYNKPADYIYAYTKYVPGKKWQDAANWQVRPRILEPDYGTNALVNPGDVFVMTHRYDIVDPYYTAGYWYEDQIDFNFAKCPWGAQPIAPRDNAIRMVSNVYMFKILNDSVKNGLKPATNINDLKLIDMIGWGDYKPFVIGGVKVSGSFSLIRKPNVYKPNANYGAAMGTTPDDTEWTIVTPAILQSQGYTGAEMFRHLLDGIGSQIIDPVTVNKSTVTSTLYKVSPGYSAKETIKGLTNGTSVADFYNKIIKANPLQTLKVVKSAGTELAEADKISNGDMLIVLSADGVNTSTYTLDVTAQGLSSNALLTSTKYTIDVTGSIGTISGFPQKTLLKTILDGVIVPPFATLTITDENDAYMSLVKLNYDSAYVNVVATDKIYFEVVAENGSTKILYQLKPNTTTKDAYVLSDVYSIDQFASLIQLVPDGTSVSALLSNLTPAPGASIKIVDKGGFVRETGGVYRDDKVVVTSADGSITKVYYLSMLNFFANYYLAFVISDDYTIDQVLFTIKGPLSSTTLSEFKNKLYPSFGATLKVLDRNGNVSTAADLSLGDQLVVTAADGKTTALYAIDVNITEVNDPGAASIKMYPNPTSDKVIIHGLTTGNRVQVFNAAGITLRDVIVDRSTEYVSLYNQPAGIYIFVISNGTQHINIQKIVKK